MSTATTAALRRCSSCRNGAASSGGRREARLFRGWRGRRTYGSRGSSSAPRRWWPRARGRRDGPRSPVPATSGSHRALRGSCRDGTSRRFEAVGEGPRFSSQSRPARPGPFSPFGAVITEGVATLGSTSGRERLTRRPDAADRSLRCQHRSAHLFGGAFCWQPSRRPERCRIGTTPSPAHEDRCLRRGRPQAVRRGDV